jgi:transcriptional regulator with XRE-family HTH domain
LRVLRLARALTQKQLAADAQISIAALWNYEHGIRPIPVQVAERLAVAVGVEARMLYGW